MTNVNNDYNGVDEFDDSKNEGPVDPLVLEALNADHFHPPVTIESSNFILPEDQLEVHIVPRERSMRIVKYALRTGPLYLTTCYEEFSRKLISVHIASESSSGIELEKQFTDADANAPQNLMKYYNPGYDYWKSTFKRSPTNPKLFNGEDITLNTNILLKLHKCNIKQKCFEPIFGSACLYTFINDELTRITETFYFDATPEQVRQHYKRVYVQEPGQTSFSGTSINIGDATQMNPHLNMFLIPLPKELRFQEIFLIVQLNKVLTNEPDKAILPYYKGGTAVEQQKLKEITERLNKFRQPLAFGITKVFDSNGQLGGSSGRGSLSFPFFAQKLCFTDLAFAQAIREMFPTDGSAPYLRFEQIEIDMHLMLYDLGHTDQMSEKLREFGLISEPDRPHIIEAEIPSDQSQLVFAPESARLDHLGKRSGVLAMRKVTTLIPSTVPWMKSLSRQIKTKVENSLFLYILQFDKFPSSARNLCVKIELIEFTAQVADPKATTTDNAPYEVLPHIYNYSSIIGPTFIREAYGRISYHIKNSPANEEFKIRLPDVLGSRHFIKISVYHVHVKTHNRGSLMNTILRPSNEKETMTDCNCLGVGFLPLQNMGGALLPDAEHDVAIYPVTNSSSGHEPLMDKSIVRVRTKGLSSLVSSDRQIQSLIRNIPLPLGILPSSIMPEAIAAQLIIKAASIRPKEEVLEANLEELPRANPLELSQHFLVIMRALTRALLAGTCVYDDTYANPFKHCKARCRAFLSLLKMMDRIIQVVGSGFEDEKERTILESYVDFVLDEEVPLENNMAGSERLSMFVDATGGPIEGPYSSTSEHQRAISFGMNRSHSFGPDDAIVMKKGLSSSNLLPGAAPSRRTSVEDTNPTSSTGVMPPPAPSRSEDNHIPSDSRSVGSASSDGGDDHEEEGLKVDSGRSPTRPSPSFLPNPLSPTSPHFRPTLRESESPSVVVTGSAEVTEIDSDGISKRTSRRMSDEDSIGLNYRKSWGKYLTESHLSTGKFVPIQELTDEENTANSQATAYFEAIVNHITNQAVRIIEESLVGVAVYAMSSMIRANADAGEDLFDLTESQILEMKPNRYSTHMGANHVLYPFRHFSAAALDHHRSSVDFRNSHKLQELLIADPRAEELVSRSSWVHPILDSMTIPIPVAAPLYDSLVGYRERAAAAAAASTVDEPNRLRGGHWWPWLYEVLTFQWGAVLALILSSLQLISSSNLESIVGSYQFETELSQVSDKRDWRTILMEEGPLLLRMIFKSLALRIQRERKRAPVLLDEQYFNALENLVMLIAVEASTTQVGIWRSKKIILSLSHFLRSLFALIAPNQVVRLLRSFFKTLRKSRGKNEEVDLRLLMIEELSLFDYFVALNLPYALDAPIHCFSFTCIDPTSPAFLSMNHYTSIGLRYESTQAPYALVHLMISEILFSCRQDYRKSEKAWEILRDLIVRHAYDRRFQSKEAQQRIVCMYLPLIHEITNEVNRLAGLKHNCAERREALSILLYVLGGTPVRLLRSRIRTVSAQLYQSSNSIETKTPSTPPATSEKIGISVKNGNATTNNSNNSSSDSSSNSNNNRKGVDKFIATTKLGNSFISDFLRILHLLIDTFEIPSLSSTSTSSNSATTSTPAVSAKADDFFLNLLSPSISLDNTARAELKKTTAGGGGSGTGSIVRKTSLSESIVAPPQQRQSLLTTLDQRMQSRKTTAVSSRKSAPTGPAAKEGERGWIEHARKVATIATERERSVIIKSISRDDAVYCAENFSASATKIMLSMMWIILEECPKIIIERSAKQSSFSLETVTSTTASSTNATASVAASSTPFLRQQCIDEAIACHVPEQELAAFLRQALCVPLHALYCNQVESALAEIYSFVSSIVKRFGAKLFLVSLEDSLQYWLRITLIHFASQSLLVRHTACNFFLTLLDTTFQQFGNFSSIATTVLAILNDVLNEILEGNRSSIQTVSDEDRTLRGFIDAFQEIRELAERMLSRSNSSSKGNNHSSEKGSNLATQRAHRMAVSVLEFVRSVEIVFRANADVRHYLSLPAGYDFFGANLLDGPFDDRTYLLLQVLRQNRKTVKNDLPGSSASTTAFQLEEVMMHFVEASEVYDVYKLPRFKMQWLENLARLHQSKANRAEGAEIRWRIFQICEKVESSWQMLWSPRPPLPWQRRGGRLATSPGEVTSPTTPVNATTTGNSGNESDGNRDFYRVLTTALDSRPMRPWLDMNQFWTHKITALTVSRQFYSSANLISLAERAAMQLIHLYRRNQQIPEMIEEYNTIGNYWKAAVEKGITNTMALGTFYRVFYTGQGTPAHLREKEFIFRNANHLHVSEFHSLIISHLKSIVAEGVEVKMIQDNSNHSNNTGGDSSGKEKNQASAAALIVMNSVKPMRSTSSSNSGRRMNSYRLIDQLPEFSARQRITNNNSNTAITNSPESDLHRVTAFQYSVPFTQDGTNKAHAKKMDEQWMKITILSVKESFPDILTRQVVQQREVQILSPIEVAIFDIEERIESMEKELEFTPKNQSDNNNLMRIVQGTVLPQVNAGAAEVAKIFLNPDKITADLDEISRKMYGITSNDIKAREQRYQVMLLQFQEEYQHYQAMIQQLKVTLLNFLHTSKLLLLKCRYLLVPDQSMLDKDKSKVLDYHLQRGNQLMGYDILDLIPLTYPSLAAVTGGGGVPSGGSMVQSMNLNYLANAMNSTSNSMGGSGAMNLRGSLTIPGGMGLGHMSGMPASTGGGVTSGGMLGSNTTGNTTSVPNPPASTPLSALWKAADMTGSGGLSSGTSSNNNGNNPGSNNNPAGGNSNNAGGGNPTPRVPTAQEIVNTQWQNEMEKGFDVLVQTIYPFIADMKEAEVFNVFNK